MQNFIPERRVHLPTAFTTFCAASAIETPVMMATPDSVYCIPPAEPPCEDDHRSECRTGSVNFCLSRLDGLGKELPREEGRTETMSTKLFGKHRGVVTDNFDPTQAGRIKVQVSGLAGTVGDEWAMPCVPCDLSRKVASALPKVGTSVWIEFEQGDPSRPVWTGCFWSTGDTPPALRNK